jgi:ABC-type polysaccharide transport system permease subunit
MWVSFLVTLFGTALSLVSTMMMAYALSRPNVFGGKPILLAALFTFLFPAGMIPSFLVVTNLKLTDHLAALFVPVMITVFNLVIMRGFFQGIPEELYEAARLDGAGWARRHWHVTLPSIRPVIVLLLILRVGDILSVGFDQVMQVRDQFGPAASEVIDTYIYYHGVQNGNFSVAAVAGLFKGVVALVLVLSANKIAHKLGEQGVYQ